MAKKFKTGRNSSCPCGSGKKFKHCCDGKTDWNKIYRNNEEWLPHMSTRGRNILFMERIMGALQMDSDLGQRSLLEFKQAFTPKAVASIHEAIMDIWPPNIQLDRVLSRNSDEVTGLYIGDYEHQYIQQGIVRHSSYTDKILVVDPFIYPASVRDQYNPILNPGKYRTQTLKNVNFWLDLAPWIDEGIVEVIRTPCDFDPKLNWDSMMRQERKYEESERLQEAASKSVREMSDRHKEDMAFSGLILSAPDEYLEEKYHELGLGKSAGSLQNFMEYIQQQRDADPNFIEPLGPNLSGQLHTMSTGANCDTAMLTAGMTGSYLITDVHSKWVEIEIERENCDAFSAEWSPFAKAFQDVELKCLDNLSLKHALTLRKEGKLEGMRMLLKRVWRAARSNDAFSEGNARLLAEELNQEIELARVEWNDIDKNLIKWFGSEMAAGALAAGPLVTSGHAGFLAAAVAIGGAATLATAQYDRKVFPEKYPAAFFLNLK